MDTLQPTLALIVHSRGAINGYTDHDAVLSLHGIVPGPDRAPVLDAGRLLTSSEAITVAESLTQRKKRHDGDHFLSPFVLRSTPASLTWYRPAAASRQFWRTGKGIEAIHAVLPGLIFHVQEGTLAVAAYVGDVRPNENTPLFAAPLGNVYQDTRVCTGNAALPAHWEPESRDGWMRVLLDTNYGHVNHNHCLRGGATTEQLIAFWKRRARYAAAPSERFLQPLKKTAMMWVNSFGGEE